MWFSFGSALVVLVKCLVQQRHQQPQQQEQQQQQQQLKQLEEQPEQQSDQLQQQKQQQHHQNHHHSNCCSNHICSSSSNSGDKTKLLSLRTLLLSLYTYLTAGQCVFAEDAAQHALDPIVDYLAIGFHIRWPGHLRVLLINPTDAACKSPRGR